MNLGHTESIIVKMHVDLQMVFYVLTSKLCLSYRYIAMTSAALILGFGLNSKPETSMMVWAKRQAKKELDAEGA